MPPQYRNNAFERRQSPPAGAAECIRIAKLNHSTCKVANDCDCSANDNDWLWGWVNQDCGPSIFDWWRADLVARCPLAFIHDRPPTATVTPRPQATSTSRSATSTSTRQTVSSPTSRPSASVDGIAEQSSEALTDSQTSPQAAADSQTDSAAPAVNLATEPTESSSQSPETSPTADQNTQSISSLDDAQGPLSDSDFGTSTAKDGQTLSSATSSNTASSGVPLLEPLEPSSPGQVSKVNVGLIAGIVIAVAAVVAIFLAFWYRAYRRKQRANSKRYLLPSPMSTSHNDHDASGSEAWAHFGGAKGSMIPSPQEEENEKNAPIYNMFSKRNLPPSPGISSLGGLSSMDRSYSQHYSAKANPASGKGILSSMKPRWMEGRRSLIKPVDADSAHPRSRFTSSPLVIQDLTSVSLSQQWQSRQGEDLATAGQMLSYPSDVDENPVKEDLAPYPPSISPGKTPADSVYEEYIRSSQSRPNTALTHRSLPRDMSVFDEEEEAHDFRAASTRAPSLDLAWVTQGDSRIPVPSWAAPRKPYSMRSKKSSKSGRNRSTYRHSIISTMSGPSMTPSRSSQTSSSGQSRSTMSSIGPLPDMSSFNSIPSFRLEIGADRAKAILQLLVTSPATPTPYAKGGNAEPYMDESRPVSMGDDLLRSPNLRDSASS